MRRANKFGAKRAALFPGGKLYDSQLERDYAAELHLLARAGEIHDLQEQRRIELFPGFYFRVDFDWLEAGRRVYADVKGVRTERFRACLTAWRCFGPGVLRVVARDGRKRAFRIVEEVPPGTYTAVLTSALATLIAPTPDTQQPLHSAGGAR